MWRITSCGLPRLHSCWPIRWTKTIHAYQYPLFINWYAEWISCYVHTYAYVFITCICVRTHMTVIYICTYITEFLSQSCAWLLEITFCPQVYVCLCVCLPSRHSSDIDPVWLCSYLLHTYVLHCNKAIQPIGMVGS